MGSRRTAARTDAALLRALAGDVMARRKIIDPFCPEVFYIRVIAAFFDLQALYSASTCIDRGVLLETCRTLAAAYEELGIDERAIGRFLSAAVEELSAEPHETAAAGGEWQGEPLPEYVSRLPGMLYPDVMRYYRWIARTLTVAGHIVEMGAWLGLATCCLADGLRANPGSERRKVYAFDAFRWRGWMGDVALNLPERIRALKEGDSFLPVFLEHCAPYRDRIAFVERNICVGGRDLADVLEGDGLVALVVVDLSDDYDTQAAVWDAVAPRMQDGKTIVAFSQFGNAGAHGIRAFCRDKARHLKLLHRPVGSARGFLYLG